VRAILAVALSLVLASSLFACKPTDFFTEVVITPFSDVIDYDNPTKTTVNSPDAAEESASLTALDWTEESTQSVAVENLVTWSANPTSTLTTHHSIYDLKPRFPGIEASDAVKLLFATAAELDHEVEANEQDEPPPPDVTTTSTGGADNTELGETASSEDATTGESTGEGAAGEEAGGSDEPGNEPGGNAPDPNAPGTGEGPTDTPGGQGEDPYGGYNGEVAVYNPNDGFARVNRVEHLAVLGNDIAVLAQSIGGAGAICAMNENAWYGLDEQGVSSVTRYKTNYTFRDVFSGEFLPSFEETGLLWSGSGASPDTVRDIDALVTSCGERGVIVYDQRLGYAESLFNLAQRQRLQAAGIQLVPVELSTVQGMLDAAQVIGEALSESTECVQDAPSMAREYSNTVNNIVRSVAAANGGFLGTYDAAATGSQPLTAYNSPPVGSVRYTRVYGYIATDSESGLTFNPSRNLDVSDIVLFGNNSTWMETPLSFWLQTAGVWDGTAHPSISRTGLQVLWPSDIGRSFATFSGGHSGGALTRWLGSPQVSPGAREGNWNVMISRGEDARLGSWGLGSKEIPYLIVCASDGKAAVQIKQTVVESMLTYKQSDGTRLTPYSTLRNSLSHPGVTVGDFNFTSSIGALQTSGGESPFYAQPVPLAEADVVRANPTGLLGSWTEGTMESVLEAIWIADIYSRSPEGCDYVPITNMDNFRVSIGGVECTNTRDAVLQFYQYFYRCDASGVYNSIVTDEGL
jgi:hypothetical protein